MTRRPSRRRGGEEEAKEMKNKGEGEEGEGKGWRYLSSLESKSDFILQQFLFNLPLLSLLFQLEELRFESGFFLLDLTYLFLEKP